MARKQLEIAGTERPRIKEIDDAAEAYQDAKKKRMKLTEQEVDAKKALGAVMRKNKVEVYRDDNASPPLLVVLTPGEDKIKVTEVEEEASYDA